MPPNMSAPVTITGPDDGTFLDIDEEQFRDRREARAWMRYIGLYSLYLRDAAKAHDHSPSPINAPKTSIWLQGDSWTLTWMSHILPSALSFGVNWRSPVWLQQGKVSMDGEQARVAAQLLLNVAPRPLSSTVTKSIWPSASIARGIIFA